jgi:RNA polymerase sigma-70 factor (ECF subfamily)
MNTETVQDFRSLSDEDLIAQYCGGWHNGGAEDAAAELFRRYQPRILRWCCRFTHNRDAALDLTQEILLRAYRNLDHYRGECRFTTWLYVITRNLCMSALQKRASEPSWIGKAFTREPADCTSTDLQASIELEECRRKQWDLILKTLDTTEARVMLLHYGKEMPLQDVSRMLGLTNKSGAKAYIVSARRKLNAALTPDTRRAVA